MSQDDGWKDVENDSMDMPGVVPGSRSPDTKPKHQEGERGQTPIREWAVHVVDADADDWQEEDGW